jgi:hypothetical protein
MLPVKIYRERESRRSKYKQSTSSDFIVDLPVNITLPQNAAFYITDITIPVSWYMIEADRNNCIDYRSQTLNTQIVKATIPEREL